MKTLDRIGIVGSTVCAFHCALPILLSFASPSASAYFGNEGIHLVLLATVIPVALFSFLHTRKLHGNNNPLILGTVGIFALVFAVSAGPHLENINENFELIFTIFGSLVLISGHFLNSKLTSEARK